MGADKSNKPSYILKVYALLPDYIDQNVSDNNNKATISVAAKNIEEFTITSNPRKINVTLYKLKLKGLEFIYQDFFLNSNLLFYIQIIEKLDSSASSNEAAYEMSIVMDNIFKIYDTSHTNDGKTLLVDYDLITLTTNDLLSSQYYSNSTQSNDVLLSYSKPKDFIIKIISDSGKRMSSQIATILNEMSNKININTKDILIRTKLESTGENIQAFRNMKLPVNRELNDINCIQYIIDNFMLQYSPTYFTFDDSRMSYNALTTTSTSENDITNDDVIKTAARLYTYVFVNLFDIDSMIKGNCWNNPDDIYKSLLGGAVNTEGANDKIDSMVLAINDKTYNNVAFILPTEIRMNASFSRVGSLINVDDLKTRLRSKLFLVHGSGIEEIAPSSPPTEANGGLINSIRIETEVDARNYLTKMLVEKYLYENDASIWKGHFPMMRYNVLDYNIVYNIVAPDDYNYVLSGFTKTFNYSNESKTFTLDTKAEFLYLPRTINVTKTNPSFINSVGQYVSNFVGEITAAVNDAYDKAKIIYNNTDISNLVKNYRYWNKLSAMEKKALLDLYEGKDKGATAIGQKNVGQASTYGDNDHTAGRLTANGEKYDPNGLTCAHKDLPFNTLIEVTDLTTGKTVIVRVNDRGPYVASNAKGAEQGELRAIDLSTGAAKAIGMNGVSNVQMKVVGYNGIKGNMVRPS